MAGPLPEGALPPEGGDITVTGQRLRGSVIGDIRPEMTLTPLDIRAYGAGTLAELLQSLEPQTRSDRGRGDGTPVVLVNGKRVSSFREVARIPPEAIERMEVFPEELALKYGYRADQKVVNVVTFQRYRSTVGMASYGVPTEGGRDNYGLLASYLRIDGDTRWSFDAEHQHSGSLLESERNLAQASPAVPFDIAGNIGPGPAGGPEIDPVLSAAAGRPVTVAAVPRSAASGRPSLADFAAGANAANTTDIRRYRTLLPETSRLALNGTVSRDILDGVSATLNARYEINRSDSRLGLGSASLVLPAGSPFSPFASNVRLNRYLGQSGPLARETDSRTAHLGTALGGRLGQWLWSFTGNYDRASSATLTDTGVDVAAAQARLEARDPSFNPFVDTGYAFGAPDRVRSVDSLGNAELVFSGSVLKLPGGEIAASLRGGFETRDFSSQARRGTARTLTDLSRDRGTFQANVDVPLASRREKFLDSLGNLSANFNLEVEELSDFGTLRTLGYGLNWSPIEELDFIASVTDEDGAPTMQQLGSPLLVTPNVPTFDFVRHETVDVIRLDGGNPRLRADNRHVLDLGLSAKPFEKLDLTFSASYLRSRTKNAIAAFPTATAALEAAFPDRFVRDAGGRLLRIDGRPVNFARWNREQLRWGLNFSRALAQPPKGMQVNFRFAGAGARPEDRLPRNIPPGATVVRAEAGSPLANRLEGLTSRLILGLYHSWHLRDEIVIRPGLPELDLLNGSAIGNRGGQPRHELQFQAGIFQRGLGARLTANWRSGTAVRGTPGGAGGNGASLRFSDQATVNLRLFANLGQRYGLRHPWLRGTTLSLGVDNLFGSRPEVRDASGATPVGYQPAYLDPIGRSVSLSLRKVFF